VIPPIDEQRKIVGALQVLFANSKNLEGIYREKIAGLVKLKQAILQKAFAGELTAQPEKALREAAAA
jgi:type I restriction enzyme, S subunit